MFPSMLRHMQKKKIKPNQRFSDNLFLHTFKTQINRLACTCSSWRKMISVQMCLNIMSLTARVFCTVRKIENCTNEYSPLYLSKECNNKLPVYDTWILWLPVQEFSAFSYVSVCPWTDRTWPAEERGRPVCVRLAVQAWGPWPAVVGLKSAS